MGKLERFHIRIWDKLINICSIDFRILNVEKMELTH